MSTRGLVCFMARGETQTITIYHDCHTDTILDVMLSSTHKWSRDPTATEMMNAFVEEWGSEYDAGAGHLDSLFIDHVVDVHPVKVKGCVNFTTSYDTALEDKIHERD